MKRPTKVKLEVGTPPASVRFSDSSYTAGSVYVQKLQEALNSDKAVKITTTDSYMRNQLRQAATKLKVKLLFANDGEFQWVKPVAVEGELKRLMLWLREPRTVAELEGKKFELHLSNSLQQLAKDSLAVFAKEKWALTDKGQKAVA
jgi:hypothetical protein